MDNEKPTKDNEEKKPTKEKQEKKPTEEKVEGDEDDKFLQKVFERRVKGSKRSRRRSQQESRGSTSSPPKGQSGGGARGQSGGSGGSGIQIFPPRRPSTTPRVDHHGRANSGEKTQADDGRKRLSSAIELKRVPSPEIVVTPAPAEESGVPSERPLKVSQDHLKPPTKKRKRFRKRRKGSKASSDDDSRSRKAQGGVTPRYFEKNLTAALRQEQGQIAKQIQIRLTKSHALVRVKQRRRHPEKWTKEEMDWEWKELLWRMNLIGRIYMGCADVEYRIVRMSYKYHDLLLPFLVIFLMFFLPFAMWWDYVALNYYEVPDFTFMRRTGCITLIHFLAVMMNLYVYMMASLQNTRLRLRFFLGIAMFVHPILFLIRCYFDKIHCSYTPEYTIYYDSYVRKAEEAQEVQQQDPQENYNQDAQEFEPWDQFVADRNYYFNLESKE